MYNKGDPAQDAIMAEIELGNGLPEVRSTDEVRAALVAAGFEVEEATDLALTADIPWWVWCAQTVYGAVQGWWCAFGGRVWGGSRLSVTWRAWPCTCA